MASSRTFLPRVLVRVLVVALFTALLLVVGTASAASIAKLADRLRNASDFRIRVQAALALGASKSSEAVKPLCDGLEDSNATVRSAAAAGLGRLRKKAGLDCLKKRAGSESNGSVKSQIKRSIKKISSASGGSGARPPDSSSKWYVAVGPTKNNSKRSNSEIDSLVQKTMRKALRSNAGMAIAPTKESANKARGVITKHKLKGYFLRATVENPKYHDSKLTVTVRITMFTYPGKALQGEFSPKLTQSGTPDEDVESEDVLIKMAVERAIARFVTVAETTKH